MRSASRLLAVAALAMASVGSAAVQNIGGGAGAVRMDPGMNNRATDGRHNYRGGPGNRGFQRAALKKRNQVRNRRAHRG